MTNKGSQFKVSIEDILSACGEFEQTLKNKLTKSKVEDLARAKVLTRWDRFLRRTALTNSQILSRTAHTGYYSFEVPLKHGRHVKLRSAATVSAADYAWLSASDASWVAEWKE